MLEPPVTGPLLHCQAEEREGAMLLHVSGEVDLDNINMLADTVMDVLTDALTSQHPVILELSGLRYIDSVGLHILFRCHQRAERGKSELIFAGPSKFIRLLAERVGLDRLVRIFPDVQSALHALKTDEPA